MDYSRFMAHYWAWWASLMVTGFLIPEIWMLIAGRPQDTLSAEIWRLEQFRDGQPVTAWTAFHFLFIAMLLVLDVWLFFHFGWGLWR